MADCQPSELGTENQIASSYPTIPKGMVRYNGTTAGSVATYKCDNGYTLMGNAERTCTSDGQWGGDIPLCEAIGMTNDKALDIVYCLVGHCA